MFSKLLDSLFPKRCIGCRKIGDFLCSDCFSQIELNTFFVCPVCLTPSISGATHIRCQSRYRIDGLISAVIYKSITKKLVYKFKYEPYLSALKDTIGSIFCECLTQNELFYSLLKKNLIITSIPLASKKLKKRGYNHSSLLAAYVAQYFNVKCVENCLIRTRDTKPQYKLSPSARLSNIKGAFEIHKKYKNLIEGKTVFMVDDIATTCTTLREAAQVLKRNGAKEVWGITFAKEL